MNANISIIVALTSLFLTAISIFRLFNKDGKDATKDFSRVETKLDYIGGDIKEVRDDVKAQGVRQEDMAERLVKVEESTKSAHHRIDALEEKN
jgi:hypothetical protein